MRARPCVNVFMVLAVLAVVCAGPVSSQNSATDVQGAISLYFDGAMYRDSTGGNLKNGCEGWQTLYSNGESIFASRCDVARLDRLGLFATEAVKINSEQAPERKIQSEGTYLMIDFTSSHVQALHGLTGDGTEVYIVLDKDKKLLYYRAEGKRAALEAMGLEVSGLLTANESQKADTKLDIKTDSLNIADAGDRLLLIGQTANGKRAAVAMDRNGKNIRHIPLE